MENNNVNALMPLKTEDSTVKIVTIIIIAFIVISISMLSGAFFYSISDEKIVSGIYIDNINISGLTKDEAKANIEQLLKEQLPSDLTLIHNEYETSLNINQIQFSYDIDKAIEKAYSIGRTNNFLTNVKDVFKIMLFHSNIEIEFNYNEEDLNNFLEDVSTKLPDIIIQSSYYVDGDNIIITKGHEGYVVNVAESKKSIIDTITSRDYKDTKLELATILVQPNEIDIEKIHSEIYKEPVNAYFTTDPYVVYPHENGVDFKISVEEVQQTLLNEEKEEYTIPLKYTVPEVTTNMIGREAFPDLLSNFTTRYNTAQRDRTTNLRLAAEKINGTVVMPGEVFSYNTVVGKRTIEAGYKNAAIYENGQVVDGLGGGICQISTTLYNAVLYANLEIVERRNHQFVPSYVGAGRDATVVYGSTDFKFRNNRNYPIKIECYVEKGTAGFEIYGLREEVEYEVVISSKIVSSTANSLKSQTYKTLKLNGEVIESKTINKDTYKKH